MLYIYLKRSEIISLYVYVDVLYSLNISAISNSIKYIQWIHLLLSQQFLSVYNKIISKCWSVHLVHLMLFLFISFQKKDAISFHFCLNAIKHEKYYTMHWNKAQRFDLTFVLRCFGFWQMKETKNAQLVQTVSYLPLFLLFLWKNHE